MYLVIIDNNDVVIDKSAEVGFIVVDRLFGVVVLKVLQHVVNKMK